MRTKLAAPVVQSEKELNAQSLLGVLSYIVRLEATERDQTRLSEIKRLRGFVGYAHKLLLAVAK